MHIVSTNSNVWKAECVWVATILCQWKSLQRIIIKWSICWNRAPVALSLSLSLIRACLWFGVSKGNPEKRNKTPSKREKERAKENNTHAKCKSNLPWNCTCEQYAIRYAACNNIDSEAHISLYSFYLYRIHATSSYSHAICMYTLYVLVEAHKFIVMYLFVCLNGWLASWLAVCVRAVTAHDTRNMSKFRIIADWWVSHHSKWFPRNTNIYSFRWIFINKLVLYLLYVFLFSLPFVHIMSHQLF